MRNIHREHGVETVKRIGVHALFPHDRDLAAMAAQLARDLRRRSEWVVLRGDRPNTHARVEGNERLRAVRQSDGHRITRPDPDLVQNPSSPLDLIAHLCVRGRCTKVIEGNSIGIQARRIV